MKVLVTGGSGFIGSHVVDKLRDKGIDVRVYDGVISAYRKDIEFYQGSILDMPTLVLALEGIDAIFHLAAIADVKDVYNDPYYAESINVRGTINVLEAARRSKAKRVIYGSTTWVYSETEQNKVDETSPLHAPTHFYTATKLAAEYYCQSYSKLYGLETTILRYGIPYGPRARDGAVVPIFVKKAFSGEPISIAGDGSQFRKFVYVEDLAQGNVLALKETAANKIYNLDGKEKVTIKEVAETVKKITGSAKIEYTPARPGDFSGKEVSSQRAKHELGWEASTPFEEGVRRYVKWYQEREEKRKSEQKKIEAALEGR